MAHPNRRVLATASLAAVMVAAAAHAQTAAPRFASLLTAYRDDRLCAGDSFGEAMSVVTASLDAYHVADVTSGPTSVHLGRLAAAQGDALATIAAAKGCKVEALELWRFVIRYFDGPAFAVFQRQAVAGTRSIGADP